MGGNYFEMLYVQNTVKDIASKHRSIFAQFFTMQEKEILAKATGIQEKNWW